MIIVLIIIIQSFSLYVGERFKHILLKSDSCGSNKICHRLIITKYLLIRYINIMRVMA